MSFNNARRKSLDMGDDGTPPVDPVDAAVAADDSQAPAMPIGAQFINGLHTICMEMAKFYDENSPQLEPETAADFSVCEKAVMGALSVFAKKMGERYPDLPPLDGAEWVDPDAMADEDMDGVADDVDQNVTDPDAPDDSGEDVVVADDDAGDDKKAPFDKKDDDPEEDDEDDSEIEKKLSHRKYHRLKDMLVRHLDRQSAAEERRTKVMLPSAVAVVRGVAAQLRAIHASPTTSIGEVRVRLKSLRGELLRTLPDMERPPVITKSLKKPAVTPDFDEAVILRAINATAESLAGTRKELETLASAMGSGG